MSTSPSFTTYICSPSSPFSKMLAPAAKEIAFEVSAKILPSLMIWKGLGFLAPLPVFQETVRPEDFSPRHEAISQRISSRSVVCLKPSKVPRSAPRIREPPSCGNQRMAAGHCLSESGKATLEFNRPQFLVPASHLQPRTLIVTIFSQRNHGFLGRHYSSVSFTFSETPSKVFREGA
jgi:hypothetical protein